MPRRLSLQLRKPGENLASHNFNTSCKKPYTGFLLYDNAIYSNIRV